MNEIGGALRLRCHGPILSASGQHPPFLQKTPKPRQQRFYATSPRARVLYGRASSVFRCSGSTDMAEPEPPEPGSVDCVGTGADVECVVVVPPVDIQRSSTSWWDWVVLVSPFFFWGTAMVAMKPVLPKTGPLFVSAFRLIPAGFLLVAFATSQRRNPPSGLRAWLSISLFALVDASCFQGFLAEGLQKTPAGLGSVIIDSQPLTVAVLAALLFGESIGFTGGIGLILGIVGLLLLELDYLVGAVANPKKSFAAIVGGSKVSSKIGVIESLLEKVDLLLLGGGMIFTFYKAQGYSVGSSLVEEDKLSLATSLLEKAKAKGMSLLLPTDAVIANKFIVDADNKVPGAAIDGGSFSLWGSGECWMFLAAQSMAVGTVLVRWVSNYSDPVMATGWHMIIGGVPLLAISFLYHDPVFGGGLLELSGSDILALLYTSIFGSAISYGVYFYSATKGSLTKLSSLTFLTPMFASIFGYLYLDENFTTLQLVGALITLFAIYLVNYENRLN